MPDINAYLKSIGATPTGSDTKKKKKGPNVEGYVESIRKNPTVVTPVVDKFSQFAGSELRATKPDPRKPDTFGSRVARTFLPKSLETKFGVAPTQRKAQEVSGADFVSYQGNLVTKKLMEENPEKIAASQYFIKGGLFGNSNDPLGRVQDFIKGTDTTLDVSDLPEASTPAQSLAQSAGAVSSMVIAQPLINAGIFNLVSKIPGGTRLLQGIESTAMTNRPFEWATHVLKAAGSGGIFGLVTNNDKTVAENVLNTAGEFAAFTALVYPVQMFFKPIIQKVGESKMTAPGMDKIVNDPSLKTNEISKTLWFKNPKDPNQVLKVTANGIEYVPKNSAEVAKVRNMPTITEVQIEAFQTKPSLYQNLKSWLTTGRPIATKVPFKAEVKSMTPETATVNVNKFLKDIGAEVPTPAAVVPSTPIPNTSGFLKDIGATPKVEVKVEAPTVVEPIKETSTLTLKPTVTTTPEEKLAERKEVGLPEPKPKERVTPLVAKSDVRTIVDNNAEFKTNPTLTVDGSKNLTFKGETSSFTLKPSALGLNADKLEVGQKIEVDIPALKAKGADQQLRVYKNGKAEASIGSYQTGDPVNLKDIDKVKAIEMPELVQLVKDISGLTPKIKAQIGRRPEVRGVFKSKDGQIELRADLFSDPKQLQQAAATLAHEMGHLTDWLPDKTLSRGNLLGRLSSLVEFRKDFYAEAGTTRTDTQIREELYELSKTWRPFDEGNVPAKFLEYRKSAKEIYADFISVLLNNPKMAQDMAPEAYNAFFKLLDRKPVVRDAYFDLQAMLSGDRQSLIKARREGVNQMFKEGEYKAAELQRRRELERSGIKESFLYRFKNEMVSKNYAVIDRVKALEKQGKFINPDDDPRYYLEERNYVGGKIKAFIESKIDRIYKSLQEAGMSWDKELAEGLFYKRIMDGDRSKVANPRGITPEAARELDADLRANLTTEQKTVLDKALDDFNKAVRSIADEAYKEGLYKPEMYEEMKKNPTYATFQVIDYLEEGLTSKIYKSLGTLKDITNPATATIEKMVKTILAIERNKTSRAVIDTLKNDFTTDIQPAERMFTGKGQSFRQPKDKDYELVTFLREGKTEGYYVDKYIANSLNNESVGQSNVLIDLIKKANRFWFRPAFIGYNVGFQATNFIRDFFRFWKNLPGVTLLEAAKRYKQAIPAAKIRGFGKPNELTKEQQKAFDDILEMEKEQILSITYNDLILSEKYDDEFSQIERLMSKYGSDPIIAVNKNPVIRYAKEMLQFIRNLGDTIETIPKVAGYYELKSRGPLTKEDKSFIRTRIGSPDFLDGGLWRPATNELFLFSNSITQGWRSDLASMTDPKTRSGYWWKTAKLNFLPKLLMILGGAGAFGLTVKEAMDNISEYDKTNYITVPLGQDENNKTVYFRIPQDETGRFLSALLWKTVNGFSNDQKFWQDMTNIIDYTGGQIPSISPVVELTSATAQFLSGRNPYDAFRSRNVLSDDVYEAGGSRAVKDYLKWVWQQAGGSVFYSFNTEPIETDKSIVEKIATNPIGKNIWGRFLRVSNFGATEELRGAREEVGQQEAKNRLSDKDFSTQLVEDLRAGKIKKDEILPKVNQYVLDTYTNDSDRVKAQKRMLDKIELSSIRALGIPEINEITYAETNKQKAAILKKIQETKSEEDFKTLVDKLIEFGMLSEGVVLEFNLLK